MKISKSTLKKLLLLTVAICFVIAIISYLNKDEPADKESFYYITGSVPEDAKIFVNDNPTNSGNALTLFLIKGENKIEVRSSFEEEGYDMRVIKTKQLLSNDFKTVLDEKKTMANAKKSSTSSLKIGRWWRWTWQDCDTLTEVTDTDKEEMLKLFDSICSAANDFENKKDFLKEPNIIGWSEHSFFQERQREFTKKVMDNLPPRDQLTETKAPREDIEFLIGEKIVMIKPIDSATLYDLSQKNDASKNEADENGVSTRYFIGFNEMFFVKQYGKWKILMPVI